MKLGFRSVQLSGAGIGNPAGDALLTVEAFSYFFGEPAGEGGYDAVGLEGEPALPAGGEEENGEEAE